MAALWYNKAMLLRERSVVGISTGLFKGPLCFFVVDIRYTFKEEDRRNIAFELILIDGPAQNVTSLKQMREKLLK